MQNTKATEEKGKAKAKGESKKRYLDVKNEARN